MRKKGRRRTPRPLGLPITFGIRQDVLNHCSLLLRSSLEAVLSHTGTDDHVAALLCAAKWANAMCDRLLADETVGPEQIREIRPVCRAGIEATLSVYERMKDTGQVGCSGPEREALKQLVDVHDEIDKVATRRQGRDVLLVIYAEMEAM